MASEGTSRDGVEEKTRELIDRLKADSDDKSIEYLLGCLPEDLLTLRPADSADFLHFSYLPDRLSDLLTSRRRLFIDILKSEAEARTRTHDDLYENIVKKYQPEPSRTADKLADKLTDMLIRVCHIMAVEDPLFSFRPVGVGSHHDGTKVSGHGDLDFVLESLYRPGEGSTVRSHEGSVDRPKRGFIYWLRRALRWLRGSSDRPEDSSDRPEDSSDRPLVDYRVECCGGDYGPKFSILPVSDTDFCSMCEERGLLKEGRLDTVKYRRQLSDLLSSAISGVCPEVGLSFGGCNKPHFGGFEDNWPAWTVVVDGVSVDITPAFLAPKDIIDKEGKRVVENIAEKVSSRVSSCVSSSVSSPVSHEDTPSYINLSLLVLSFDGDFQLSTSLLESRLIRSVPELKSALKLIKLYKEYLFNLPGPDLTSYYRHLEERVFKWLVWEGGCDIVLEPLPRYPYRMVVNRLRPQSKEVLLLATQSRPLTLDYSIRKKLRKIKERIGKGIDYSEVYPSLRSMIKSEHQKPLIKTISYVFKSLVIQEWIQNEGITTETLVRKVMEKYIERLESGVSDRLESEVSHPFLPSSRSIKVVNLHSFCDLYHLDIEDSVLSIHRKNVKHIVSQISSVTGK